MDRSRTPFVFVFSVAALLFVVGGTWALLESLSRVPAPSASPLRTDHGPLPDLGTVPGFSLVTGSGATLGAEDLAGSPWVANFIFTTCAGVCPIMSSEMAKLQRELPEDSPLRLISISVDPGHDTPEVLQEYAVRYLWRPRGYLWRHIRWRG